MEKNRGELINEPFWDIGHYEEHEPSVINGGLSIDDRGEVRFINDFEPESAGIKRFYQVTNLNKGEIRAFHSHEHEEKYVYVSRGCAKVVIVKMQGKFKLEKEFQDFVLSSKQPKVLYIPAGWANGAQSLEDDTDIIYFSTSTLKESKNDDYRFPYDHYNWEKKFR